MDALLAMLPADERVTYSAVTGQALFYLGETDLAHKLLAIAEDEGVSRAGYALKLLQSEGVLTIASTGKDPTTGRLTTHTYRVQGPVMLLLTTTAPELDEELRNRCLVLTVDEDRAQTRAIHRQQRERQTLAGLLAERDRTRVRKLHQDAQRLLRPLLVVNPYARALTFRDDRTRTRRDHLKYLTLIRTIALLHQYQRPVRTAERQGRAVEYIEVTLEDIERFAALSGDTFYAHMDEEAARRNPLFGGRVAHGYFLVSAAAGLFVDPPYGPVLANYGIDRLRFLKPVKPGDSIKVRLTCKSKSLRAEKGYGEVAWDTEITNQNGELVASYDVLTMVSEQPVS
jgi:acyl dehydratase